ncbi:MAG: M6 family metalloprotease domain-containing protein [Candidatus Eisenbacteria bacterium]|nr:M6 family metalloprotease domain-containing protein [Candidatus Eisenbacteria bacterium]
MLRFALVLPVLILVVCAVLPASLPTLAYSMPLRPDVVERLRVEGRLAEESRAMLDAHSRGVNQSSKILPAVSSPSASSSLRLLNGAQAVQPRGIVLLVEFTDNPADSLTYPPSHFRSLLFSLGTYPTGSMRDYYLENSYGRYCLDGDVTAWMLMPLSYAYYDNNQKGLGVYPQNAQKLVEEALAAADPYVDFSQFDNDGPDGVPHSGDDDGYVDALFVVHAGPGYEETGDVSDIHSHQWFTRTAISVDGVYAYKYTMEPENGRVGVFCHEYGHVLGLPDLYDYEYDAKGLGNWSVMSLGAWGNNGRTPVHFDAWSKSKLGFATTVELSSNTDNLLLEPAEDSPVSYTLWTNGAADKQYFILENRQQKGFDSYIGGSGLVIYHVDESVSANQYECCGSCALHYLVAVEQADGECDLELNYNSGDPGDPFPGAGGTHNPNHEFSPTSTPASLDYAGSDVQVSVSGIELEGENVVFDAVVETVPAFVVSGTAAYNAETTSEVDCDTAEPGETVAFSVQLFNYGVPAESVGARITGSDPYVAVLRDTCFYGTMSENENNIGAEPFQFCVSPTCPTPHGVVLDLDISDASGPLASRPVFFGVADTVHFYQWTHSNVTPDRLDQWHISTEKNHTPGGTSSWKCGDTSTGLHGKYLDSGLRTLEYFSMPGARLCFWHWIEAEMAGPLTAYDAAVVELSFEGGPWQQIAPVGGYPYTTKSSLEIPLPAGTPCFSGSFAYWRFVEFDLSAFYGRIKIRFRFVSDGAVCYEGWYIDDVTFVNTLMPGVPEKSPAVTQTRLLSAYPNPFNPSATIRFSADGESERVTLFIFDVAGRLVRALEQTTPTAGFYEAVWDGKDKSGHPVASGVYVCRVSGDTPSGSLKLVMLR